MHDQVVPYFRKEKEKHRYTLVFGWSSFFFSSSLFLFSYLEWKNQITCINLVGSKHYNCSILVILRGKKKVTFLQSTKVDSR